MLTPHSLTCIRSNDSKIAQNTNSILAQLLASNNDTFGDFTITPTALQTIQFDICNTENIDQLSNVASIELASPKVLALAEAFNVNAVPPTQLWSLIEQQSLCLLSLRQFCALAQCDLSIQGNLDEFIEAYSNYCSSNILIYDASSLQLIYLGNDGQSIIDLTCQPQGSQRTFTVKPLETPLLAQYCSAFISIGKRVCDSVVLSCAMTQKNTVQWPCTLEEYPLLRSDIYRHDSKPFPVTQTLSLGLYPVVDSIEWLTRLLELGIKTIQLRVKNQTAEALDKLVEQACLIGKEHKARLFINDYWQLAIKHHAYGVHLGQEDISDSQLALIQSAGLRLGLSTHSEFEWLRALSVKPSYIAMGTVFPTQTKPAIEIGLANLYRWSRTLSAHIPLVAIGGIKLSNIEQVAASGVGSVAVVTAITEAQDYHLATAQLGEYLTVQIDHWPV